MKAVCILPVVFFLLNIFPEILRGYLQYFFSVLQICGCVIGVTILHVMLSFGATCLRVYLHFHSWQEGYSSAFQWLSMNLQTTKTVKSKLVPYKN